MDSSGPSTVKMEICTEKAQIGVSGSEIAMDIRCELHWPHRAEHLASVKLISGEIARVTWKGRDPMELTVSKDAITAFEGNYKWLANSYPCEVEFEGMVFPTVDHALAAARTADMLERHAIMGAQKPAQAKRMGEHVTLRSNWGSIKESVLLQLLSKKFIYAGMAEALLDTQPADLVYGNKAGDRELGAELVDGRWIGRNILGKTLMRVRNDIR